YHYVAPATSADGEALVFKCGIPNKAMQTEVAALQHYDGVGCVRLLKSDVEQGWLLMGACQPGIPLSAEENDELATHTAVQVMQKLWKPIASQSDFPSITDWLQGLHRMKTDSRAQALIPRCLSDFAFHTAQDLQVSLGEPILLHGDLHHDNILSSKRESYLAIDPKGILGEAEYEVGALARNPIDKIGKISALPRFLKRRLDQLAAETGFDRQRILQWSIVQAVLAAYWQIEDDCSDGRRWIHCAEALYESN
ncbi:MAG: fructosamine kinase family protein, partial [Gammaproteobacteria bacterium]|nr:fructosamine kinase family protein [Gammaproteobacteria bacterium]